MGTKREFHFKKGVLAIVLCLAILALLLPPIIASPVSTIAEAASDGDILMLFKIGQNAYTINGITTIMDVSPTVIEDRTMLPIRFVAEPLGAEVGWEGATSKVTVQLADTKIELWIGQSNALVNGVSTPIDPDNSNVRPLTLNDRTMLPVRFVAENLGCDVGWLGATEQVTVSKTAGGGSSTAPGSDLAGEEKDDETSSAPDEEETEGDEDEEASEGDEDEEASEEEEEEEASEEETPAPTATATVTPTPNAVVSTPTSTPTPTPTQPAALTTQPPKSNTIVVVTPTPRLTLRTPTPTPTATPTRGPIKGGIRDRDN